MKSRLLFIFFFVASLTVSHTFANSSLENNEVLNEKVHKIQKTIWKKGMIFKSQVLYRLDKYKQEFSGTDNQDIAEYVISKIKDIKIRYGITTTPTPMLGTGSFFDTFYGTGTGPILDDYEQIDPVETVLFSGSALTIEDEITDGSGLIYRVQSNEYPYDGDFFVDSRFIKLLNFQPKDRSIVLPSYEEILNKLKAQVGYDYIWGGVIPGGVPEMEKYYAPSVQLDEKMRNKLVLNGFDCSGLLHYATNGFTPRNTSKLVEFGTGIAISNLSSDEIIQKLKPLDLIGWRGHLMIVLDKESLIESRVDYDPGAPGFDGGVRIRSLKMVLDDLVKNKIGVDEYSQVVPEGKKKFVIRRWFKN